MADPLTSSDKMFFLNFAMACITLVLVLGGLLASITLHNNQQARFQQDCLNKGWFWVQFKASGTRDANWTCLKDPAIADK